MDKYYKLKEICPKCNNKLIAINLILYNIWNVECKYCGYIEESGLSQEDISSNYTIKRYKL
jgi:DNA-directed RNA polymerase subunit M/transcription elongation factor TFIIS